MAQKHFPLIPGFLLSLVVGLVVFVLSGAVAYNGYIHSIIRYPQRGTLRKILALDEAVAAYRREKGFLPKTLMDLPIVKNEGFYPTDESGAPVDSWRHPYVYRVKGNHYQVLSNGRDGKPGGVGLDYDIAGSGALPRQAAPPLGEFVADRRARGMILTCMLGGMAAGILGFLRFREFALGRRELRLLMFRLLATTAAAALIAIMISALYAPSGH
jgi:general secretion pathway protein G